MEWINENMAVLEGCDVIVNVGGPEPMVQPNTPKPEKSASDGGPGDVAAWGEENDYPQQVIERAESDTEIPPLLDWKGRMLQGRELVAIQLVWNEEEKDFEPQRINDPEINDFLFSRTTKRYWREAAIDFVWFANIFPDLIKSVGGDKIAYIGVHEAAWCRWNKQNEKGLFTKCYVSPLWPDAKPDDEHTDSHPVVDPYSVNLAEEVQKDKKLKRFVYPVNYPTPGKAYYPLAPWSPFLFSDWYTLKKKIPQMKVSLMEKMLSAKWVISIPVNYWSAAHPDWDKLKPEERRDIKKAKVKEIENSLTGTANAGKVILCEVGFDRDGKELPGWKIEPIQDHLKDGQHLEDAREASEHLMRGLNTDSTLVGAAPGKGMGGGSGSDKRIAFNIAVALLQPYRDVMLEPLYFIAEYNGWLKTYPNLRFKVLEIELETLDKSHSTAKETNPVTESTT